MASLNYTELDAHLRHAPSDRRAVVIGASIAGLLAARVLADRYDEVILLDRGDLPDANQHRKATPQSHHAHALLARGLMALEELFPGITDECVAQGGVRADMHSGVAFYAGGQRFAQHASGIDCIAVGRVVIEGAVRRRVLALARVRACPFVEVRGLLASGDSTRVAGVEVRPIPTGAALKVCAALVVDAGGRSSRLPQWLNSLGYASAMEERVRVDVCYSTAYLKRGPTPAAGMFGAVCAPDRSHRRIGVMLGQEDGRWVVTLGGYRNDSPPLARDAFTHRAQQMGREVAEVVRTAEFIGAPMGYRFSHGERRHYQRLGRFPNGLLAIGDAICSLNPIHGQGMSVAACEALALRDCLADGERGLAKRYFRKVSRVVDAAWNTAVGTDLAIDTVEGRRSIAGSLVNRYLGLVVKAAAHDPVVARAFLQVAHLLAQPPSLIWPAVVARVLYTLWRHRRRGEAAPSSARAVG